MANDPEAGDPQEVPPTSDELADVPALDGDENGLERLNIEVSVQETSACERHISVVIPREDIDTYLDREYSRLMPEAMVPGFRPGRAPRKLVESRYSKEVGERVKGTLVMDALTQISDEGSFTPISEPEFDYALVELPAEGPMKFEFDLEVRPEFEMPEWRGMKLERLVHEFTEEEIDARLATLLERYGTLVPVEGPVAAGQHVVVNLRFKHDGREISELREETIPLRPTLSFPDGEIEGFEGLLLGANPGDKKTAQVTVSHDSPVEELRGKQVEVEIELLEAKQLELPELTGEFLDRIGFETAEELRDVVRSELERRLSFEQSRGIRRQITNLLTAAADWDLPPSLLRRQAEREFERAILELRRSGFSDGELRAMANDLRRNTMANTARALKEHFILERIAEEQQVEATEQDYDLEIELIAYQLEDTPRRVRARLEKRGAMDSLRNQIVERKVLELIQEHATFEDRPYEAPGVTAAATEHYISGTVESDIPEAKYAPTEGESLPEPADRG